MVKNCAVLTNTSFGSETKMKILARKEEKNGKVKEERELGNKEISGIQPAIYIKYLSFIR